MGMTEILPASFRYYNSFESNREAYSQRQSSPFWARIAPLMQERLALGFSGKGTAEVSKYTTVKPRSSLGYRRPAPQTINPFLPLLDQVVKMQ
jgi:hypothetical protein